MLHERRSCNRFDIYATVECKPLHDWSISFFGITRNLSREGLSFESQTYDFHPGEHVEVKIRYPQKSFTLSTQGEIVWKKKADKFEYITGIKFHATDKETENRILELLSAESKIPIDEVISSEDEEWRQEIKGAEHLQETVDGIQKEGPDSYLEAPPDNEFPGEKDTLKNTQESVIRSDDLFHISRNANNETPGTTTHEKPRNFNTKTSQERGLWPDTIETSQEDLTAVQEKKGGMNLMSVVVAVVFAILLAVSTYFIIENFNSRDTVSRLSEPQQDSATPEPGTVKDNTQRDMDALQKPLIEEQSLTGQKEITNVPGTEERETPHQKSARIPSEGTHQYFLQVGSWKHAQYAKNTLQEVQKYYPEAYIIVENNFSKVRIPGITKKKQGVMISKEIERKFKVKPLLLIKK